MHPHNFAHCTLKSTKTKEFYLVKLFGYKLTVCNDQNVEYKIFKPKK